MKSSKRLDFVIFQLTPTRTRCDLVISAKGKTEKVASGLLLPFLTHLKTAKDQIDKGGYSILLKPGLGSDTTWFTKGTVERFVRFVSNPEILERVYSLQSEILQLEKAITFQGKNGMDLVTVGKYQAKSVGNNDGTKYITDANNKRAIVLYEPETHPPKANGSTGEHGDSKVQFLKVLETRKNVQRKEQGMAFARAIAAGFDIDDMASLLSFAKCFGASRLMEACLRFIDLWKQKHETGQWVEVERDEAMTIQPDFSLTNASGVLLSDMDNKQVEQHGDLALKKNGRPSIDASCSKKTQQECYQGEFPYPTFPIWPVNSAPGSLPVYQSYPKHGVPYYQPYPGTSPFYTPPYQPVEDSEYSKRSRGRRRRHSMDSRERSSDSEELVSETGASPPKGSRKKSGISVKKQHGAVVIKNINYVASKGENYSDSESEEALDSENYEEIVEKNTSSSKKKGTNTQCMGEINLTGEEPIYGKESGGHWEAFQNCLLRDSDEKSRGDDQNMFGLEKNTQTKLRLNTGGDNDPLADIGRVPIEAQNRKVPKLEEVSSTATGMLRSSNDERFISREEHQMDNQMDVQITETNGENLTHRYNTNDLMIAGRERQSYSLSTNVLYSRENVNGISRDMTDESFLVPTRSISLDQDRTGDVIAIDMNLELAKKLEDNKTGKQVKYEPDYLSLMPERGTEEGFVGYNPTLDYEMQVPVGDSAAVDNQTKELRKLETTPDFLDKKKTVGLNRKVNPSKSSPLENGRAHAEKLRSFKTDLQKLKKEKEAEQQKRLVDLKKERQNRIAARSTSTASLSPSPQQAKKQLPTKTALSPYRGSKFSDSEPHSSSPLQRSKLKSLSKTTKSANDIVLPSHRSTRSVPSFPESRKETKETVIDPKASMVRIRRLSEPKPSSSSYISSVKTKSPTTISKPKVSAELERKKIVDIINLDKRKAATLPELKMKSGKSTSQKVNKYQNNEDDILVVDKTVVMFEPEKPSTAVMGVEKEHYANHEEVVMGNTDKEPPRTLSSQTAESPYEPPFAHLSSTVDPCTRKLQYGEMPSMTSDTAIIDKHNDKVLVPGFSNMKIQNILKTSEKTKVQDSPKGFRRLLKFGKKSQSSRAGEKSCESDKATYAAASSEVHSLKNLLSQDESRAGGTTTHKSSRHFSLLSPFRSKNSEKKSTT